MKRQSQSQFAVRQPRYLIVAQALLDDIEAGRHAVGDLLPSEAELGQHFNVSRHTVREAIRRLTEMGMVFAQAGVGTKVTAQRAISHYSMAAEGIPDLFQYAYDVSLRILSTEDIIADENLTALLHCPVGQKWVRLLGERFIAGDKVRLALTEIYVAAPYRSAVQKISDPDEPIYALIESQFGLQAREVRQEISAIAITPQDAEKLGTKAGDPGLRIVRKYRTTGNELFEVAISLHPADRFSYTSTLRLRTAGEAEG